MRMKLAASAVALIVTMLGASARADDSGRVVKDHDAFAIDFSAVSACFATPPSMRELAPCPGVDPAPADTARYEQGDVVAAAKVDVGDAGARAVAVVLRMPGTVHVPDAASAKKLGDALERGLRIGLHDAGTVRAGEGRLVHIGEVPVMRLSASVDGLGPADPRRAFLEHVSYAAFFTDGAVYVLSVGGPSQDAAVHEALLERLAETVRVAKPAPRHLGIEGSPAYVAGWLSVFVVAAGALLALVWRNRSRRARNKNGAGP